MRTISARPQIITPVQRALIIQRVIVDRWTIDRVAATFGVPERLVARWIVDYRRNGMASLHDAPSRTLTAEIVQVAIWRPVKTIRKIWQVAWNTFIRDAAVQPLPLRRSSKDGPR